MVSFLKGAALLVLAAATLSADQTRIWTNNTDQYLTVKLVNRSPAQAEKGNMGFSDLKGITKERPSLEEAREVTPKDTQLGEAKDGPMEVKLRPYSRFLVEFTTTWGAFNHTFSIVDYAGHPLGTFTCDKSTLGSGVKVVPVDKGQESPLLPAVVLDGAVEGDLSINPRGVRLVNSSGVAFRVTNVESQGNPQAGSMAFMRLECTDPGDKPASFKPREGVKPGIFQSKDYQAIQTGEGLQLFSPDGKPRQGVFVLTPSVMQKSGKEMIPVGTGGKWVLRVALDEKGKVKLELHLCEQPCPPPTQPALETMATWGRVELTEKALKPPATK